MLRQQTQKHFNQLIIDKKDYFEFYVGSIRKLTDLGTSSQVSQKSYSKQAIHDRLIVGDVVFIDPVEQFLHLQIAESNQAEVQDKIFENCFNYGIESQQKESKELVTIKIRFDILVISIGKSYHSWIKPVANSRTLSIDEHNYEQTNLVNFEKDQFKNGQNTLESRIAFSKEIKSSITNKLELTSKLTIVIIGTGYIACELAMNMLNSLTAIKPKKKRPCAVSVHFLARSPLNQKGGPVLSKFSPEIQQKIWSLLQQEFKDYQTKYPDTISSLNYQIHHLQNKPTSNESQSGPSGFDKIISEIKLQEKDQQPLVFKCFSSNSEQQLPFLSRHFELAREMDNSIKVDSYGRCYIKHQKLTGSDQSSCVSNHVYAIGDCCDLRPDVQFAFEAIRQAQTLATNLTKLSNSSEGRSVLWMYDGQKFNRENSERLVKKYCYNIKQLGFVDNMKFGKLNVGIDLGRTGGMVVKNKYLLKGKFVLKFKNLVERMVYFNLDLK